jgi:hypothetical protein
MHGTACPGPGPGLCGGTRARRFREPGSVTDADVAVKLFTSSRTMLLSISWVSWNSPANARVARTRAGCSFASRRALYELGSVTRSGSHWRRVWPHRIVALVLTEEARPAPRAGRESRQTVSRGLQRVDRRPRRCRQMRRRRSAPSTRREPSTCVTPPRPGRRCRG